MKDKYSPPFVIVSHNKEKWLEKHRNEEWLKLRGDEERCKKWKKKFFGE